MVGTRHSLPSAADNAATEDAEPETAGMSKKAQAALKKLQIDGKGALVGEKPQQEEFETYHFRGAVYAVSKDTKKEWIEAEPERYRRRKARRESGTGSIGDEREDSGYGRSSEDVGSRRETPIEGGSGGRRVRFGSTGGTEGDGVSRKRKRSMGNAMEDIEDGQGQKRRRSIGARKSAHPSSSPRGARQARMPSPARGPLSKKQTAKSETRFPPHASSSSATTKTHTNNSSTTDTAKMVETRSNRSSRETRDEQLRQTQRNLLNVVRMNERYENLKNDLKKIFLRRHLRELRNGGGNQLSTLPDPSNLPAPTQPQDPQAGIDEGDTTTNPQIDEEVSSNESSVDITLPAPGRASRPSNTNTLPTTNNTSSFSLNDHLTNPDRAESALFAARRASTTGAESRSTRRRRMNRELDDVRNSWAVEDAAPTTAPAAPASDEEGDFVEVVQEGMAGLPVPRPGVPLGAPHAKLPDEVRGRMGLFSEAQREEVRDVYLGEWSPPRPSEG